MATTKDVKQIIQSNQNDIAFIVGNGIHRYENKGALAWDQLLIDLWNITQSSKISEIHTGTTYTEFYDILEMKCEQMAKTQIKRNLVSCHPIQESLKLFERIQKLAMQRITNDEQLNQINMLEALGTVDPNAFTKTMDYIEKNNAVFGLQTYISNVIGKWQYNDYHKKIAVRLKELNAPILTTNFDKILENSIALEKYKVGNKKLTDYYPWSTYYSNKELSNPLSGFGIWHINGVIDYRRSIKLGLSQYMGL